MAAMVLRIDMIACAGKRRSKSFIARRMFGKAVAELDNPTRPFGNEAAEGECGAIESWQMVNDFE
ncbi:hypothetical protein BCBD1442_27490 [Brucella ceti]|nr:hypothetical protein BCBD1442_27490 [Brucella ceti]